MKKLILLMGLISSASTYSFEVERNGEIVELSDVTKVCVTMSRLADQISIHKDPAERVESSQCYVSRPWTNRGPNASENDLPIIKIQICQARNPEALWSSGGCSGFNEVEVLVVE